MIGSLCVFCGSKPAYLGAAIAIAVGSVATAQAPRVRDSAGVRIIENGPRLTAPIAFELAPKPSFDAGGLEQDPVNEISTRNGYPRGIRLSNGNVVVLDPTRVHFFDAAGKRIRIFGRQGRGPGEFVQTSEVCATRGDTVIVGQSRLPITKLTGQGEFISVTTQPTGMFPEGPFCFDDGTYALINLNMVRDGPAISSTYRFTRIGEAGAMNPLADLVHPPFDMLIRRESPKAVRGNRLYFGYATTFEIFAFDPSGKLVEIIRTSDPLVAMTDADKTKMPQAGYRAGSSPAEIEASQRRAIAESKTKFWPTMGRIYVDATSRLWIEDWAPSDDPTQARAWTAFSPSGALIGRLVIPGVASKEVRRRVVHFGKDEILFYRIDDDGAAHYTAYPIFPVKR